VGNHIACLRHHLPARTHARLSAHRAAAIFGGCSQSLFLCVSHIARLLHKSPVGSLRDLVMACASLRARLGAAALTNMGCIPAAVACADSWRSYPGLRDPLCFFILGVSVLLPWNCMLLAFNWFVAVAQVGQRPVPPVVWHNLPSILSAVFSLTNASCTVLASRSERLNRVRSLLTVPLPLVLAAFCFALLSLAAFASNQRAGSERLSGSVVVFCALPLLALLGMLTAVANCGSARMAGLAEAHSGRALNASSVGQAVAGFVPAIIAYLFAARAPSVVSQQALAQQACGVFAFTAGALVASTFAFAALPRTAPAAEPLGAPALAGAAPPAPAPAPAPGGGLGPGEFSLATPLLAAEEAQEEDGGVASPLLAEDALSDEAMLAEEENRAAAASAAELARQLRMHHASALLTFMVSLSVFPGLTSFLKPANANLVAEPGSAEHTGEVHLPGVHVRGDLLVPATFVVFGAGDVAGRLLAALLPQLGARPLLALCVARVALVPLLLCCRMVSPSNRWALPHSFGAHDTAPVMLLALLAVSNGYCFSAAFAAGPGCVHASKRGSVAQTLVACLVSGVVLGSIISLLLSVALSAK
jgi:hypothetical protein